MTTQQTPIGTAGSKNTQPLNNLYGLIKYEEKIIDFYDENEAIMTLSFAEIMRYPRSLLAVHLVYLMRSGRSQMLIDSEVSPDVFRMVLDFYQAGVWPCYTINGITTYGYHPDVNCEQDFKDLLAYYNLPMCSTIQHVNGNFFANRPPPPKTDFSFQDFEPEMSNHVPTFGNIADEVVFYIGDIHSETPYIILTKEELLLYPDSLLTVIASTLGLDEIQLDGILEQTLREIGNFYHRGIWSVNPYKISERCKFTIIDQNGNLINSFFGMCEYLSLPDDIDELCVSDEEELYEWALAMERDYDDPYDSQSDEEREPRFPSDEDYDEPCFLMSDDDV